jgi:hypothetical protein
MAAKEFDKTDYPSLCEWYRQYGQTPPQFEDLPDYGLIVPSVAAGFLVQTDTPLAMLDFFIGNRQMPKDKRNQALNEIVSGLIGAGSALGFKCFRADTQLETVRRRALDSGFGYLGDLSAYVLRL